MENRARKLTGSSESKADTFDLDTLLHPASAFAHPMNVVRDAGLTLNEKRAILASWASDACAVEAAPDLRANASGCAVRWDEIMDALRILDGGEVWEASSALQTGAGEKARWCAWTGLLAVGATGTIKADPYIS
jgi:hypothetical protein